MGTYTQLTLALLLHPRAAVSSVLKGKRGEELGTPGESVDPASGHSPAALGGQESSGQPSERGRGLWEKGRGHQGGAWPAAFPSADGVFIRCSGVGNFLISQP